jgi:hypothetical protein
MLRDLGAIADVLAVGAALALVGCSSSSANGGKEGGCPATAKDAGAQAGCPAAAEAGCPAASPEMPPQGASNVEAWLKGASYKQWKCEPSPHASRAPSPHGFNRICSNKAIAENAAADEPWPKGAAAVKELYAAAADTTPIGYAVYLKTAAESGAGANWYWYERGASGVVADGLGGAGTAKTVCVGCHAGAGSDAMHTPSPGGRDEVYTPVH